MLHFQLQALFEKRNLLKELFIISFCGHVVLLLCLFFIKYSQGLSYSVRKPTNVAVRFVATLDSNKIASSQQKMGKAPKKNSGKKEGLKKSVSQSFQNSGSQILQQQSVASIAGVQKKTGLAGAKKSLKGVQKKTTAKESVKARGKSGKVKREAPGKKMSETVERPGGQAIDFMSPHKYSAAVAREALLKQIGQFSMLQSLEVKGVGAKESAVSPESNQEEAGIIEEEMIVYVSPQEYSAMMIYQELQEALEVVWVKPVGLRRSLEAHVTLKINSKGMIIGREFTKLSGVLVYDESVEQALDNLVVPKSLWSKMITISFNS